MRRWTCQPPTSTIWRRSSGCRRRLRDVSDHGTTGGLSVGARATWSVDRHALRLEFVECPTEIAQLPFDHRVPLKRGHRIVEALHLQACRIPLRGGAY